MQVGIGLVGRYEPDELRALVGFIEDAGFTSLWVADERLYRNVYVTLTLAALSSRTLRLGTGVTNPFTRHPALTAAAIATVDEVSGGRVVLGLGAGGSATAVLGLPRVRPAQALREAVHILRGLWAHPSFTYHGRIYHVQEAQAPPRPVRGTIPIWIGALRPQMLAYTGRIADGWLKNRGWPSSLDELRGLVAQLEAAAEQAGRDPATIRRALNGAGGIGESAAEVERIHRAFADHPMPGGQAGLVGTVDQILETIAAYREAGVDTFHLQFPPEDTAEQIRWFGRAVLPRARALAGAPA